MANNTAMTVRPQFNQHVANMGVDLNNNLGDNKARTGPEHSQPSSGEKNENKKEMEKFGSTIL